MFSLAWWKCGEGSGGALGSCSCGSWRLCRRSCCRGGRLTRVLASHLQGAWPVSATITPDLCNVLIVHQLPRALRLRTAVVIIVAC